MGKHSVARVHADEPLGSGAVDHWGFVAPAVRVAVGDGLRGHQAVALAQHFDDARAGFPDIHAAKQGQFCGVAAVALYGIQNLVVLQTVGDTAIKVVHTISGRRVDDARAVTIAHVVGQVEGGEAVVAVFALSGIHPMQWVAEDLAAQRLAFCRGDDRAFELVALQALLHEASTQKQHAARGVHQGVFQLGVGVQGLVGGDRPSRGRPDDGKGFFATIAGQCREAKGCGKGCGVVGLKGHVQRVALFVGVFDFKLGQR